MGANNEANGVNGAQAKVLDIEKPPNGLFLNNEFVVGEGKELPLINPKDGSNIGVKLQSASQKDVDSAVKYAQQAYESGPWSTWTGAQRGSAMFKLADLIDENTKEIAYLESVCSGRPLGMLLGEIPMVTSSIRYFAGWADKIKGDSYPPEDGFYKIVRQEPLGVCAGITAWNASLLFCAWKSSPALATGNTVIIKSSEKSPLGTLAYASLIEKAGFPAGVFQVVVGGGDVGDMLSRHMGIRKISFTGSTFTGRKVQDAATKSNLKRVTLELGGKSPAIIFKDADIDKAVWWTSFGITINAGQVCAASSRLFVEKSIADEFYEKLNASFKTISETLGSDPQDATTQFGPLVDKGQYEKVWKYIEEGKKTTKVLTGGEEYKKGGYYMAPTVFIEPDVNSKIYREEIFGPVLCVKTFETEEEVLQLANDTDYGLAGAIFTQNVGRALRVSSKVHAGTVCVNCNLMVGPQVPMGGFGASGIGRELGEYGLKSYLETKTVWISMN